MFAESELRQCGYDRSLRTMYFEKPWKLRCEDGAPLTPCSLWLVPETLVTEDALRAYSLAQINRTLADKAGSEIGRKLYLANAIAAN